MQKQPERPVMSLSLRHLENAARVAMGPSTVEDPLPPVSRMAYGSLRSGVILLVIALAIGAAGLLFINNSG
jgi:hypothetical protein